MKPEVYVRFNCMDCGVNTHDINEYYMLKNEVWYNVVHERGMLCVGCIEIRLGRLLTANDFIKFPINLYTGQKRSERLKDRLKGLSNDNNYDELIFQMRRRQLQRARRNLVGSSIRINTGRNTETVQV